MIPAFPEHRDANAPAAAATSPRAPADAPIDVTIRAAALSDAPSIAAIYNEGIRGRSATFETTERSAADIEEWFVAVHDVEDTPVHPFLVAIDREGTLLGWVRASSYRGRHAYRRIAEYSVYVATTAQRRRVGDALMAVFLPACAATGITKLVSRIFPENRGSLVLCARHGFREVGTYQKHGQLDGVWRDVVIVERLFPENLIEGYLPRQALGLERRR